MAEVHHILRTVAREFGVRPIDIIEQCRIPKFVRPRQAACLIARKTTDKTYTQIARVMRRDHTTIIHSVREAEKWLLSDPEFSRRVGRCTAPEGQGVLL